MSGIRLAVGADPAFAPPGGVPFGRRTRARRSALAQGPGNRVGRAALLKNCKNDLTIKLDGNWSSFQLANSTPPQSVIDNAIAPPARIREVNTRKFTRAQHAR